MATKPITIATMTAPRMPYSNEVSLDVVLDDDVFAGVGDAAVEPTASEVSPYEL